MQFFIHKQWWFGFAIILFIIILLFFRRYIKKLLKFYHRDLPGMHILPENVMRAVIFGEQAAETQAGQLVLWLNQCKLVEKLPVHAVSGGPVAAEIYLKDGEEISLRPYRNDIVIVRVRSVSFEPEAYWAKHGELRRLVDRFQTE
ncbi:hypothetical protein PP175_15330 [Aneurinibacillus sp. Ricciae_BoGa-3]|uniref:hypothetical protein n=1 Tax=Aneurinibacillus sp. Ricciae_BoGa-3 TaxID=3022697 RepID=UPI00234250C2|nr:hypothetical protein [Aneurinibacillus sp. Ricciae_BoGa-3]WCK52795.1 hypothetical protein PP175_15330 [Aneurinibacillus sp. Ricciae_BoGa-3]